jgi:hypothetical protein
VPGVGANCGKSAVCPVRSCLFCSQRADHVFVVTLDGLEGVVRDAVRQEGRVVPQLFP